MRAIVCDHCGGDEFMMKDGYRICKYCKSKFALTKEEMPTRKTTISLNGDVQRLLNKIKQDPKRARKYATLILEIDPNNKEAKSILNLF